MGCVLVVEDDDDIRESLQALLERRGHAVDSFANGREALVHLRSGAKARLILLDLMMPVMNGWEMRSELLHDPALSELPVVLLSGVSDLVDIATAIGVVEVLQKPIDLPRLYAVVDEHCRTAAGCGEAP